MIELIDDLPRNVVGISVKGRVTREECREILAPAIAKSLRWRDKIRLYYELGSRFPGSGWDDLDLGFEQRHMLRADRDRHRHRLGQADGQGDPVSDPGRNPRLRHERSGRGAGLDHRPARIARGHRRHRAGSSQQCAPTAGTAALS